MALTWPLGAVMSRAGVEGGGVPVGMALREVGGAGAVDVGGAWGAGDLWLGGSVRVVARVGVRPTEPAAGVVTGALAVVAVGRVTWLDGAGVVAGGTVAAGALVAGARGVVTGATVGDVVGSPAATRAMVSTPPGRAGAGEVGPAPTITTVSHSATTTAPELAISLNLSLVMAPVWSVANSLYEIVRRNGRAPSVAAYDHQAVASRCAGDHPERHGAGEMPLQSSDGSGARRGPPIPDPYLRLVKAKNSWQSRPAGPAPEDEGIAPISHGEAAQLRLDDSAGMVDGPASLVNLRAGDLRAGRGRAHAAPYASGEGSPGHTLPPRSRPRRRRATATAGRGIELGPNPRELQWVQPPQLCGRRGAPGAMWDRTRGSCSGSAATALRPGVGRRGRLKPKPRQCSGPRCHRRGAGR